MSYASETGYVPMSFDEIMDYIREGVNDTIGTTYDADSFVGTNFYKFFYVLAQRVQEGEIKTAEIFAKVQDYFNAFDQTILQPKISASGLIDTLRNAGYAATIQPPDEWNAGKLNICVDVNSEVKAKATIQDLTFEAKKAGADGERVTVTYLQNEDPGIFVDLAGNNIVAYIQDETSTASDIKSAIESEAGSIVTITVTGTGSNPQDINATVGLYVDDDEYQAKVDEVIDIIKSNSAAGVITTDGFVKRSLALSNGQSFDFGFVIPVKTDVYLRLTLTPSRNNNYKRETPEQIRDRLLNNIATMYRFGSDLESERYFTVADAPWAADIKLEWALDTGGSPIYQTGVYETSYTDLLVFSEEKTIIIEE